MTNPKRIILFVNKTFPPFPPFPLVTYHCLESKIIPDLSSRQWVFWRESRFLALPRAVLPAVTGLALLVGEHVGFVVLAAAAALQKDRNCLDGEGRVARTQLPAAVVSAPQEQGKYSRRSLPKHPPASACDAICAWTSVFTSCSRSYPLWMCALVLNLFILLASTKT